MKRENESDRTNTATTLTETQYLSDQARQAKAAISDALSSAVSHTARGADPRVWTKSYPKSAVAIAAVAAFTAAVVAVPSKEEQALNRLIRLQQLATGSQPRKESQKASGSAEPEAKHAEKTSWAWTLSRELFNILKPMLLSIVTGYMAHPEQNGHDAAASPGPQANPQNVAGR